MATIHFLLSLDLEFFFNSFFRDKFWKFDFGTVPVFNRPVFKLVKQRLVSLLTYARVTVMF